MQNLSMLPEMCKAEQAATHIAALVSTLGITENPPDVRTLRLWRTKKYVSISGSHFTRRNLLEVLVILKLRQEGFTLQKAVRRALELEEDRLVLVLTDSALNAPTMAEADALITLQLLARGILALYQQVSQGAIVGYTDWFTRTIDETPLSLIQAMARLGRAYFIDGHEDHAASLHQLLALCEQPLKQWAPRSLTLLEGYTDAILVDPIYRVPNEDCEIIAEEASGTNLGDLIEHHLHEELMLTVKKMGPDADKAYTAIREFIARHPLVIATELQQFYTNPELTNESIDFVRRLYQPVHASYALNGVVRRCRYCRGLIGDEGLCILAGCRDDHPVPADEDVALDSAYLARPEVLKYWVDPAREELRIYDALRKVRSIRDQVQLYPHSDWCDVAIGEVVGIDVKDYLDPVRLAQRLNRSIGHLSHYPERILAIAQRRWKQPFYIERLLEQLTPERRTLIQVKSVTQVIRHIKSAYGGEQDARKT